MEKLGLAIAGLIVVFVTATLTGTIIWLIWEHTMPYFFPMWIKAGLPSQPEWWKCVMLVWLSGSLFKVKPEITKD